MFDNFKNEIEQKLNSEDNKVNNLDLNQGENTDYIRIEESAKDNVHEAEDSELFLLGSLRNFTSII